MGSVGPSRTRARILLLSSCLPFPYEVHGGAQRTSHLLRALRKAGEVDIALVGVLPDSVSAIERAREDGLPIVASFPREPFEPLPPGFLDRIPLFGKPLGTARTYESSLWPDAEIRNGLQHLAASAGYDLLVCRFLRPAALADLGRCSRVPVMLDWDDVDYLKLRSYFAIHPWTGMRGRLAMRLAMAAVTRRCNALLESFAHVWLASPAEHLAKRPAHYSSLPNVAWHGPASGVAAPSVRAAQLVFVGNLGHQPNAQALSRFIVRIWPSIKARVPGAHLLVVGRLPSDAVPPEWTAAEDATLLGEVPELESHYAASVASVCPVDWGGGSNVKAIESLSHGVPCVGTPYTCEPFREFIGEEDGLVCAGSDSEFADACTRLLLDPEHRNRLSVAALEAVASHYSTAAFDARVMADVARVLGDPHPSRRA